MLAWVVSIITVISVELTIRKQWWGWLLALFNQVLWFILIVSTRQWGLLLLNAYMAVQGARGAVRWYREQKEE